MNLPLGSSVGAAGLLLLRLGVAAPLVPSALAAPGWQAVVLWAGTALLATGLLTPVAAFGAAVHAGLVLWRPDDAAVLHTMLPALALMLVGAGRLSLDAWVFGPRLVMVWPESRP